MPRRSQKWEDSLIIGAISEDQLWGGLGHVAVADAEEISPGAPYRRTQWKSGHAFGQATMPVLKGHDMAQKDKPVLHIVVRY